MSFVSNGGKFKLYTVLRGLIFPTPTQLRISFQKKIFANSARRFKSGGGAGDLTARLFGREDFDVIVSESAHFLYLFPIRAVR
jgi:hypothetical protein